MPRYGVDRTGLDPIKIEGCTDYSFDSAPIDQTDLGGLNETDPEAEENSTQVASQAFSSVTKEAECENEETGSCSDASSMTLIGCNRGGQLQ